MVKLELTPEEPATLHFRSARAAGGGFYWLWPKYAPEAWRVQVEWLLAHVTVKR